VYVCVNGLPVSLVMSTTYTYNHTSKSYVQYERSIKSNALDAADAVDAVVQNDICRFTTGNHFRWRLPSCKEKKNNVGICHVSDFILPRQLTVIWWFTSDSAFFSDESIEKALMLDHNAYGN